MVVPTTRSDFFLAFCDPRQFFFGIGPKYGRTS